MRIKKLTCGITMGDPAGIGPEIILKTLKDKRVRQLANFFIIGNSFVLRKTAQAIKAKLKLKVMQGDDDFSEKGEKEIGLIDVGNISRLEFGQAQEAYGLAALDYIKAALKLRKKGKIDILVTAPVNKHTISQAGCPFKGHTEYLAKACKIKNFAMMLLGGPFKVVLVTRHIALKDVPKALTKKNIYQTLMLAAGALKKYFGIRHPRIGVCGLNPHAGDNGILGKEENMVIRPAINMAKTQGSFIGPLAADTLFYLALHKKFDAVVAMYHDQGLIPLKTYALDQGVNFTLGLPFVRTSCAHGTAYDIAGKNKANPESMIEAIKLAVQLGAKSKGRG